MNTASVYFEVNARIFYHEKSEVAALCKRHRDNAVDVVGQGQIDQPHQTFHDLGEV